MVHAVTIHPEDGDELDLVGTELDGRYRIERFLGAGTMGAVYQATQLAVGRRVAIKVLNKTLKTSSEVRGRFRVEAQAIAALNHPNCITLFDFGYNDRLGALYMVVEFLEGDTLEQHLAVGVDTDVALSIAFQVADVLAQAHESGVLHRDLKPENIMLVEGTGAAPNVKVLDFGLARIFDDSPPGKNRLTRQGQLFGTPAYMSPEQCGGAIDVGPAADIYSLGITLYEMLADRLPFYTDNVAELLIMHTREEPPPFATDAPPEIVDLVFSMLDKDPANRPTAPEVADALRDYAALAGRVPARPKSITREVEEIAPRARRKPGETDEILDPDEASEARSEATVETLFAPNRSYIVAAAGGAAVLLSLVLGFVFFRADEANDEHTVDPSPITTTHGASPGPTTEVEVRTPDETLEVPDDDPANDPAASESAEAAALDVVTRVADDARAQAAGIAAHRSAKRTAPPPRKPVKKKSRPQKPRKARTLDFTY